MLGYNVGGERRQLLKCYSTISLKKSEIVSSDQLLFELLPSKGGCSSSVSLSSVVAAELPSVRCDYSPLQRSAFQ